jgi:hypothetical protein
MLFLAPPTRDYLPLVAVVCGFISYWLAGVAQAWPHRIIEETVFLGAPSSPGDPKRLEADPTRLLPPTTFAIPEEGQPWDIGADVYRRLQEVSQAAGHDRWLQARQLANYSHYLRDPDGYLFVTKAWDYFDFESREKVGFADLFQRAPRCPVLSAVPVECGYVCPGISRIECLAALDKGSGPFASGARVSWRVDDLKAWLGSVEDAVNADLQWRWDAQAVAPKMHAALSGGIGFFLTLAVLIAWAIRDAAERSLAAPAREPGAALPLFDATH